MIKLIFIVVVLGLGCLGPTCYDPLICYNPLVGYDPLICYNPLVGYVMMYANVVWLMYLVNCIVHRPPKFSRAAMVAEEDLFSSKQIKSLTEVALAPIVLDWILK